MKALPNLAARPFVNRRPLVRLALAAWIVGGLLAAFDTVAYWRYTTGEGRRQQRAVELEADLAEQQKRIDQAVDALVSIDLDWQADQVRFVNLKTDEQAFSWSQLFDRLAEVLPDGVRLARLNPGVGRIDAERLAAAGVDTVGSRRVTLAMNGTARSSEALYEFVDALFAHPAFQNPDLQRETERGDVEFSLSALYLPDVASSAEASSETSVAAEGDPEAEEAAPADVAEEEG